MQQRVGGWLCWLGIVVLCAGFAPNFLHADEETLHVEIDRLIETGLGDLPRSEPSADPEFLRRVFLDLAGRIPTNEETLTFLDDSREEKRSILIDELLASPDHARRMRELFHAMLMERRGDNEEWDRFLTHAFEQRMPWHEIVRSILKPNTENEATRGAAFFLTQRLTKEGAMAPVDVPGLTRDVGRLFAGRDLQCAECHNHLTIEHFQQQDFQGLHMIFENIQSRNDLKFPAVSEKLLKEKKSFQSVFGGESVQTGLMIPGGREVTIPVFAKEEEYLEPPDRKTRNPGVPRFSPLQTLAEQLASTDNPLFARNIANRMWFIMMGHGLVEPLDLLHPDNPPSHPELLDLLASSLSKHDFDLQWMLRELALTQVYQRSSRLPASPGGSTESEPSRYATASEKRMSAEQLFWSVLIASGELHRESDTRTEESADVEQAESTEPVEAPDSPRLVSTIDCSETLNNSDRLKDLRKEMIATFSNPPREPEIDFSPSVRGALYLMHDERFQALLIPESQNLMHRVLEAGSSKIAARELFLSILSRYPNDSEQALVDAMYDREITDRSRSLTNLAWALFSSTEFAVNH